MLRRKGGTPKRQNDLHIDLQKPKGRLYAAVLRRLCQSGRQDPGADLLVTALEEIDVPKRIMKYPEWILPVYQPLTSARTLPRARSAECSPSKRAAAAKGSIGVLRRMYELGVRMMTLTSNHTRTSLPALTSSPAGATTSALRPQHRDGLKEKGFEFLAEMERLHIIADVSHLSDKGLGQSTPPAPLRPATQLGRAPRPPPQPHRR